MRIIVARDFSKYPGGPRRTDGPFSGEAFREDVLIPALKQGAVEVVLDGTLGYASNWLCEAFGKLTGTFTVVELEAKLSIVSDSDPSLATEAFEYIREGSC